MMVINWNMYLNNVISGMCGFIIAYAFRGEIDFIINKIKGLVKK